MGFVSIDPGGSGAVAIHTSYRDDYSDDLASGSVTHNFFHFLAARVVFIPDNNELSSFMTRFYIEQHTADVDCLHDVAFWEDTSIVILTAWSIIVTLQGGDSSCPQSLENPQALCTTVAMNMAYCL